MRAMLFLILIAGIMTLAGCQKEVREVRSGGLSLLAMK